MLVTETMMGGARAAWIAHTRIFKSCSFLKMVIDKCHPLLSQGRPGVDAGPIALVKAGLVDQLKSLDWNVDFTGHQQFTEIVSAEALANDSPIGKMKNPRTVSAVTKRVAEIVAREAKSGKVPLTLGGDHSLVSFPHSTDCQSHC